jgi:hypothetical protein
LPKNVELVLTPIAGEAPFVIKDEKQVMLQFAAKTDIAFCDKEEAPELELTTFPKTLNVAPEVFTVIAGEAFPPKTSFTVTFAAAPMVIPLALVDEPAKTLLNVAVHEPVICIAMALNAKDVTSPVQLIVIPLPLIKSPVKFELPPLPIFVDPRLTVPDVAEILRRPPVAPTKVPPKLPKPRVTKTSLVTPAPTVVI